MAVIARKQPQRIPDLLAYQTLTIESQMKYQREAWIGYDRRFSQRASTNPHIAWSANDTTLWNLAFAGKAKTTRCSHCFSLTHKSNQCEWAPDQLPFTNHCQVSNSQPISKHGILTGVQATHSPTVLSTTFAGIAVLIPK